VDALASLGSLTELALLVGLSTARIAVAFLLLPVFAPETVSAMVRNSIFAAFALLAVALQPAVAVKTLGNLQWIALLMKEAAIGAAMGFALAAFLWAFEAAGQLVDAKLSLGNAQVVDPLSGQQVSLSGAFLGRLASFLFMAGGGFSLFIGVLIESFALWPVAQLRWSPPRGAVALFEQQFASLASLAFLIAAPSLVVMFAIDLALGLVNRYAPQLNVISISMSVKAVASTAVWLLMLGTLAQLFSQQVAAHLQQLLPQLRIVLPR
jgi:type III secretion protein SpaR/YscT/HrcT